jgi:hypothetical protein
MEYCDDDREYIRVVTKTEPFTPRKEREYPNDTMQTPTYTRAKLQAQALARKRENVRQLIQHTIAPTVLREAGASKTSYLYPPPHPNNGFTPEDIMEGLREWFPDCAIELTEEWVDLPPRKGLFPTRELKSGIKIDWS